MQINLKTLNVGIIGKGDFTDNFLRYFIDKKYFGLCCGLQSHKLENLLPLRNYDELDKAVDAVLIFDPTFCLYENILEIVKSLKHVFITSTSHISKHQLKKLSQYAYEAGVKIQVSNGLRFLNIHNEIKDLDLEPRIIECNHYIARKDKKHKINLIEEVLLPDLDVVLSISRSRVKSVSATGVGVLFEDPDVVNARIDFYNGCVATISASKIADKNVHKIRFFQNNNYHTLNYQNQSLRIVQGSETSENQNEMAVEDQINDQINYHKSVNSEEILEKEIESFYYCIVLGTEPAVSLTEFVAARDVADRILDQLERNFERK
ncbi:MAG: hypothetical protein H6607_03520 [Flavobacteriales bacterium]|nr:hypothetical protein [Flavobacteriales bacterium]